MQAQPFNLNQGVQKVHITAQQFGAKYQSKREVCSAYDDCNRMF